MDTQSDKQRGHIIGIGGVFLKSTDRDRLLSWYRDHLGFEGESEGVEFKWRAYDTPEAEHRTVWAIFPDTSTYFDPSNAAFMINYIVDDLDALLEKLAKNSVKIDPKREAHDYGRFAWIYDPDGNKIELWEPPSTRG